MIKDSGDRTEFETGAKRDMHAGKGRMDLLPWYGIMEVSKHCEEGALKYGEHNVDTADFLAQNIEEALFVRTDNLTLKPDILYTVEDN